MTDSAASDWSTQKEVGTPALFRLVVFLALHSPVWLERPLTWIVCLSFTAWPGRSANAASRKYLARALGRPARFLDVQRHNMCFATAMLDRIRVLAKGGAEVQVEGHGHEVVGDLLAQGRSAILLGAHYGSFEVLRAFKNRLPGLNIRYLMYEAHNQSSMQQLAYLNPEIAANVISLTNGPTAMLELFEHLNNHEFIAFLGDRLPGSALGSGLEVDFLGGRIGIPTSPFIAAIVAKLPIIMCFAPRTGDRTYSAQFKVLYDGRPIARAERDAVMKDLAQSYARELERLCLASPYNWFNFFDIWHGESRMLGAAA